MNSKENHNNSLKNLSSCIKVLSADAVERSKSGHPGMPLGFSDVMTILAFEFLKFNPLDPKWFNRDRLVLSAGHGSMLLYSFFYLAGYKDFTLEDIKNFRKLNSKAAGHPEHELYEAIETTTGPLGQGIANSVGMAIAEKKYKHELGSEICSHKIYTIVGDGCLMEGISYEAASLAGHLQLNNLIILFDDNNITIDGRVDLSNSENHLKKFESLGFHVIAIDGHDFNQIRSALSEAQNSDKPVFIACKTFIGKGANKKENSEKSHGSPLGSEEIQYLKSNLSVKEEDFYINSELKNSWEKAWLKSAEEYNLWQEKFHDLPKIKQEYIDIPIIKIPGIVDENNIEATRASSGKIIELIMKSEKKVISGSADLAGSNCLKNSECKSIVAQDFSGNFINYGVREHAMASIMNGLALSGFAAIGGTFFVFSDYMRPAMRLASLMELPVIYVMTHDSIGVGEDGPTHQPIEHLASFRAMPNINVFRPADFIETKECYEIALESKDRPSMIVLSRQSVPKIRLNDKENLSSKGGYVISEASNQNKIDIVIFATGTEVSLAIEVQQNLELKHNLSVRVCSVPSFELLSAEGKNYLSELKAGAKIIAAIEAASSFGWHKIIGSDGMFFGIDSFGASAPANDLYKYFGLTQEQISEKLLKEYIV